MPTDALLRPTALQQFASSDYDERMAPSARSRWSPSSSDSGDDESNDANDANDDCDELNKAPGPAPAAATPLLAAVRPAGLQLGNIRNISPPRSSPLSPLASGRPSAPAARVRLSPLAPMSASNAAAPSSPRPNVNMPKGQALARSLLSRAVTGASAPQRPKKTTKLIVPTKAMRTTFELTLSADELARKA